MNSADLTTGLNLVDAGTEMYALVSELYPICRSITGGGVRETLRILQSRIPLTIHEIPSGTPVFDWNIPREWNIRDACVKNAQGERVIDFRKSNLHVVSYSVPVRTRIPLDELKEHLFTLPDHPDWIPYRTSYYAENWGFCLSHNELMRLKDGEYEVLDRCVSGKRSPYLRRILSRRRERRRGPDILSCLPSVAVQR